MGHHRFSRFLTGEEGQDLVEYSLLVLFIALAVMLSVGGLGTALSEYWQSAVLQLQTLLS